MASLIVCHACDLAQRYEPLATPMRVRCARCRAELLRTGGAGIDAALALCLCALILLAMGCAFPLIALTFDGTTRSATLPDAAATLYSQGYAVLAVLVLATTIAAPLGQILAFCYVLLPLKAARRAPGSEAVLRWVMRLRPWALTDVFLLGALVALVKLSGMAEVTAGISLFAYAGLMLCLAGLASVTGGGQPWRWLETAR